MGRRRRRRKRRLEGRPRGRDARPETFVDVRVERNPKGRRKNSAKLTKRRRRNGNVSEERATSFRGQATRRGDC